MTIFFPEVVVQLVPSVVRKSGSLTSSPLHHSTTFQSSEVLKNILDSSTNIIPNEVVGCLFEYEVKADESPCYVVNILCTFSTKSELDKFETLCENGHLAKKLEQYLEPKIRQSQYDFNPGNGEFKLEINIIEKTKNPQQLTCTTEIKKKR